MARLADLVRSRAFRGVFLGVTVVLAAVALALDWEEFAAGVRRLGPPSLVLAAVFTVGNILLSAAAWRSVLADLGSRLSWGATSHVFLVGQLGKYLPGSLWHVVAQVELAADHGVSRRRSASATVVHVVVVFATALLLGVAGFALVPDLLPGGYTWVALLVVPLLVLLWPPVLNRVLARVLAIARRPPLEHSISHAGAWRTTALAFASWCSIGAQTVVLVARVGDQPLSVRLVVLGVTAFALAWCVGFATVVSPAGAGAREAALVLMLSGVMSPGRALLVAVVSRVLMTTADLSLAGLALVGDRRRARGRVRRAAAPQEGGGA
ncbi:lysylphosphatidylglycerol synthase domain-containing protein [Aquipuribacter nitratireducens]|uniref:Lysylphosphatidylglycerol synthase domain-containing protein n=1 Tax=Aquipuribacter nitratireducens TaxID=650104 RepID=A0ABW0GK24_9MICO